MTFENLLERLADSDGDLNVDLIRAVNTGEVVPVLPGPGTDTARSLHATFTIRAKSSAGAGIKTIGLQTILSRLEALDAAEHVLLFHFSGTGRVFSVFVRALDAHVLGILEVER